MNLNEFKAEIVRTGMTLDDFSKKANFTRSRLSRRMDNPSTFTLIEILLIVETLNLSEEKIMDIFFSKKVS